MRTLKATRAARARLAEDQVEVEIRLGEILTQCGLLYPVEW